MDTSRLQAVIAVQHLKDAHVVGEWEKSKAGTAPLTERRHPLTGKVYARVVEGDKGASLTVWDHTSPNTIEVLRDETWVDAGTARHTADHMLKVQGVFFLADLME